MGNMIHIDISQRKKLKGAYCKKKQEIEERLKEFKSIYKKGSEEELFAELCFCLLTPQSKAKTCWAAVLELRKNKLLSSSNMIKIAKKLKKFGVRFHNKKAKYIVDAYTFFSKTGNLSIRDALKNADEKDIRKFLVENINGIGYKEASHFLRNIGLGENYAILDRHIIKNLKKFCIIENKKPLTKTRYLATEEIMKEFAEKIGVPLSHLDLLFWSEETNEIFK